MPKSKSASLPIAFCISLVFAATLSRAAEPPSQIPTRAGGAFREFMAKLGGRLKYDDDLFYGSFAEDGYRATIFPFGRSLERNFADARNPRLLVNISTADDGYVHFSYTPLNNQLQIISSNDSGRGNGGYNDFIVVDDFAPGRTPRVSYAPKGLCTACHQGGNLIFPQDGWNESAVNGYGRGFKWEKIEAHPTAIKAAPRALQVWSYDIVLRQQAERFAQRQSLRLACNGNVDCRIEIAKVVLSRRYDISKLNAYFDAEPRVKSYLIPSDRLSSREVTAENNQRAFTFPFAEGEDPLFPRAPMNFRTTIHQKTPPFRKFAIPEDVPVDRSLNLSDEEIADVFSKSNVRSFVQKNWPLQQSEINQIFADYRRDSSLANVAWADAGIDRERAPRTDAAAIFDRYCMACHDSAGGPAPPIDFSEADTFVGRANRHRTSLELVSRRLMPPAEAAQMRESERAILIQYLKSGR